MRKSTIVFLMVLLASSVVLADDFYPPEWRGWPLSVEAEWDFDAPPSNWYEIGPSKFNAVPGMGNEYLYDGFLTHAEVDFPQNWLWEPIDQGGGITPAPGSGGDRLTFALQNWVDQEEWKDVRIQLTGLWEDPQTLEAILGGIINSIDVVGTPIDDWSITDSQLVDYAHDGRFHAYIDLQIWPNPDWEKISAFIPESLIVDQVYIDTISIPEPATIALLGIGCLLLRRKKT